MTPTEARKQCLKYLHDQIWQLADQDIDLTSLTVTSDLDGSKKSNPVIARDGMFGIQPFYIQLGKSKCLGMLLYLELRFYSVTKLLEIIFTFCGRVKQISGSMEDY